MPSSLDSTAPTRRRRFQFSLRKLMVVIALLAVFVALISKEVNRHWQASRAARDIIALGGKVHWEYEVHETILRHGALTRITDVILPNLSFSDKHLSVLQQLPQQFGLHVEGVQFSDASLSYLERTPKLRYLVLVNTRVTDYGIANLKEALPHLIIMHNYPSDPGFREIR